MTTQFRLSDDGKELVELLDLEITECSIPNGVCSIGSYAFHNCDLLERITIPDGVTSIGQCAFLGCSALKEVILPESIAAIPKLNDHNKAEYPPMHSGEFNTLQTYNHR